MITSEQIQALDPSERAALVRQLAELQLPARRRYMSPARFGRAVRAIVTIGAVVMVPWTIYLALSLPRRVVTDHWRGAWVGFDLLLAGALASTAWFAWRRRQLLVVGLATSAVLLVCDAWFDVTLTRGSDRWVSLAMALLVELPLAAMFGRAIMALQGANADIVWALSGHEGPRPPLRRFPLVQLVAAGYDSGGALRSPEGAPSPDRAVAVDGAVSSDGRSSTEPADQD